MTIPWSQSRCRSHDLRETRLWLEVKLRVSWPNVENLFWAVQAGLIEHQGPWTWENTEGRRLERCHVRAPSALSASMWKNRGMSQEVEASPKVWKGWRNGFSPSASRNRLALLILCFSLVLPAYRTITWQICIESGCWMCGLLSR